VRALRLTLSSGNVTEYGQIAEMNVLKFQLYQFGLGTQLIGAYGSVVDTEDANSAKLLTLGFF